MGHQAGERRRTGQNHSFKRHARGPQYIELHRCRAERRPAVFARMPRRYCKSSERGALGIATVCWTCRRARHLDSTLCARYCMRSERGALGLWRRTSRHLDSSHSGHDHGRSIGNADSWHLAYRHGLIKLTRSEEDIVCKPIKHKRKT